MSEIPTPEHVYIAGPMRGHDGFNFPAFFEAEATLRRRWPKAEIINPAREDIRNYGLWDYLESDPTGLEAGRALKRIFDAKDSDDIREVMADDLAYIVSTADTVITLDGWQGSRGASAEVAAASAVGAAVVPYVAPQEALTPAVEAGYEVRQTSSTGGQKGAKAEKFYQIPAEPLALLAEHFGKGAKKYAAHNFRKGFPWSLCFDALMRHAWAAQRGEDYDVCPPDGKGCQIPHPETGVDTREKTEHGWTCYNHTGSLHLVAAMWQTMVLVEFYLHHKAFDDRFIYGRDGEEHNGSPEET